MITTAAPLPADALHAVDAELDRIDRMWSRFRPDSTVAEMCTRSGRFEVADNDQPLLDWYRTLYDATSGSVTPLVGQTLVDAGYDPQYSLLPRSSVAAVPSWDHVIADHRDGLELRVPTVFDVGAAGKGFAVDRVAEIVAWFCADYIVDGGGDMRIAPGMDTNVRVALEHPTNPSNAIGVVTMAGGSVCASASNRRAWADWHHIVDPAAGSPAREVLATWVIVPDAAWSTMIADGLATALFFTSAAELRTHPTVAEIGFEYVVVRRNGSVEHSGGPDHVGAPRLELFL